MKKTCPGSYPNFDKPTLLCYSTVCGVGFYRIPSPEQCIACLYDCATCGDGTSCLTCDATVDLRALDLGTSRCLPLPGYYDDGTSNNSIAQLCSSPCQTCDVLATYCTSCITDIYYVSGGIC